MISKQLLNPFSDGKGGATTNEIEGPSLATS